MNEPMEPIEPLRLAFEVACAPEGRTWRDRNMGGWSTLLPHYIEAAAGGRAAPNGD